MRKFLRKNVLRKIPAIAVMAGIFALSALPSNDPLLNVFQFSDKMKHVIAYFVLGVSFCMWIPRKNWFAKPFFWGILIIVLSTVFGIIDEYHQSFVPGRSGNDLGDLIADVIGASIAPFAYFLLIKAISIVPEPKPQPRS
jgi:VanZ family protein